MSSTFARIGSEVAIQRFERVIVRCGGHGDMKRAVTLDELLHVARRFALATRLQQLAQRREILVRAPARRVARAFRFEHALQLEMVAARGAIDVAHRLGRIDIAAHVGAVAPAHFEHAGIRERANRLAHRVAPDLELFREIGSVGMR